MRVLGLDVGERRIGVAICDYSGLLATPYTAIVRRNLKKDVETIVKIAAEEEAVRIVVGMPFSLDGSEGYQARKTRPLLRRGEGCRRTHAGGCLG